MSNPQKSPTNNFLPPFFLVFDVESVGLHGVGFAVGYVVLDTQTRARVAEGLLSTDPDNAEGTDADREWVEANVSLPYFNCPNVSEVQEQFWTLWMEWKARGAALLADCAWPVEAHFLIACVNAKPAERNWMGPYPLYDLAPMLLLLGSDPLATTLRESDELPAHNPLNDARQSARLLADCLTFLP